VDGLRYIDTCEFWKDQYTKIHLENRALQHRILALEQKEQQSSSISRESIDEQVDHHEMGMGERRVHGGSGRSGRQDNEASRKRPAHFGEYIADYQERDRVDFSFSDDICLKLNNYGKHTAQWNMLLS